MDKIPKDQPKRGRPPKEGQLRNVSLNLRLTGEDRELLRLLTEKLDESSDTQTIIKLIRKEAKALRVKLSTE